MTRHASLFRTPDWANIITRAVAATSAQTAAIATAGDYELSSDTDCYVLVGSNPTAAAGTSMFIAAGRPRTLALKVGEKVAVIRKTADGTLTLLRMF
jgi:hypothetical protein